MKRLFTRAVPWLLAALGVGACESGRAPKVEVHGGAASTAAPDVAKARIRPVFLRGPTDGAAIAPFIAGELAKGRAEHRGILVYVGATWCEPCQRFHQAVQAGELDDTLDGVRLVEFDLDADRGPLEKAGYASRLIPLFALPNADGTASEHRIEGSVKGPAAVKENLLPRLQAFLRGQSSG